MSNLRDHVKIRKNNPEFMETFKLKKEITTALKQSIQDLVDSGVRTSFTDKELKQIGVILREDKNNDKK
jgi:hypothetical protein